MGTLIIGGCLAAAVAAILYKMVSDRKKGKSVICGGDCARCGGACRHAKDISGS